MNLQSADSRHVQELVDTFYWYHTIDLGNGVVTKGTVDHASALDLYGFPSVSGKSVLDIGAEAGFFSFQFEKWGARSVIATDIDRWRENPPGFDYSPRLQDLALEKYRPRPGEEELWERRWSIAKELGYDHPNPFFIAKTILGSSAELKYCSIYDLDSLEGPFDVVFCGTVNENLKNILVAFESLRKATREICIVAASGVIEPISTSYGKRLLVRAMQSAIHRLGLRQHFLFVDKEPVSKYTGNRERHTFWKPNIMCLKEMLEAAGFRQVSLHSRFALPNLRHGSLMKHAVFHCYP